jgi:type VI secretion system protein ImpJ
LDDGNGALIPMAERAVHWHEGMFLRPHQLQAAQRHAAQQVFLNTLWDHPYYWGLRVIELDRDALANHRFVIRRLRLRLRDGTLLDVPDDGTVLPALDLKPHMERESTLTVSLGVPVVTLSRANVAGPDSDGSGRYLVDSVQLEDENTGINPQPIHVRRLNVKLLLSTQDDAGYETLKLATIEKSGGPDATPQLHEPYIPPLLTCEAWGPLQYGVLQRIYDLVGRKIESLAEQVVSRGISLEATSPGDALIINQLRVLNELYATLHVIAFSEGIHPLTAYYELCRAVGQLAIFGLKRRPPNLPRYDHDNLGYCFFQIKNEIDAILVGVREPEYEQVPFKGIGKRMEVALQQKWLLAQWQMFVGVKSLLSVDECNSLLTKGQLNMKIGSAEQVERIFQLGLPGLKFSHSPTPPRALPGTAGLVYYQVSRDPEEWANVQQSLTLAIRLNEHRIAGDINGKERTLTIRRANGQTTTMDFDLYVVKNPA